MCLSCTVNDVLSVEYWCDLEIWVSGCSMSLKMAPINRSYTPYYWSVIVTASMLHHFSYLTFDNIVTLKYRARVTQSLQRWHSLMFPLLFHCNYVSILYRFWDILRRIMAYLWNLVYGQLKWRRSIHDMTYYWFAIARFSSYLTLNNIVTLKFRLGSLKVTENGTIR